MDIVLVDSSRVVQKVVAAILEPRGHHVRTFSDSEQALECVAATPSVRALITSLEVRPIPGLDLCRSARRLAGANRPLSILVMSSAKTLRNLAEALDSGADDFMEKPPGAEELLARLRAAERLTTMQEQLIRLAETDPLTGLLNRRALFGRAEEAAAKSGPLAAVLADIDHFKRINDTHGHDIGDLAIRAVADLIGQDGIAGRLGGEEFAIVFPRCTASDAAACAERLRQRAADLQIPAPSGPVRLTCSFGVSERTAGDVGSMLKAADDALYRAKRGGRNRVVTAFEEPLLARTG